VIFVIIYCCATYIKNKKREAALRINWIRPDFMGHSPSSSPRPAPSQQSNVVGPSTMVAPPPPPSIGSTCSKSCCNNSSSVSRSSSRSEASRLTTSYSMSSIYSSSHPASNQKNNLKTIRSSEDMNDYSVADDYSGFYGASASSTAHDPFLSARQSPTPTPLQSHNFSNQNVLENGVRSRFVGVGGRGRGRGTGTNDEQGSVRRGRNRIARY
jgi:hypothetical protein